MVQQIGIIAWRDGWPYLFANTRNLVLPQTKIIARRDTRSYLFDHTRNLWLSHLTEKMQERNRRRLAKDCSYTKLERGSTSATNQLRYLTKLPFYPMFPWKSKTQFLFLLYLIFFSLPISIYFLVIEFQMKNQMNYRRFAHNNCNSIKPIGRFKNSSTNHRYCLILSSLSF